jgi:hypothetical protein
MKYIDEYLNTITFNDAKQTILGVTSKLFDEELASFDYQSQLNGIKSQKALIINMIAEKE